MHKGKAGSYAVSMDAGESALMRISLMYFVKCMYICV